MSTAGPADVLGLVGTTIDHVRFDACVDAGGFGLIYRGYHEGLGEEVAIKCLRIASIQRTNEAIREALAGRFRDETRLLYRLSQGNLDIVRCIGSGTVIAPKTNEYTPYMVLEWLDGCTLSAELKERRSKGFKPRTLGGAVALLDSAAGGLAYAHAHDVVHRDVKPGNLFLARTREGVRMKVLDFGLAKILSDESIGVRPSVETGVGVHFCSPSYGAPEQFTGQIGKIGPWTDVYSLTLVLYEVMTGEKVRPAATLAEGLVKAMNPKTSSPTAKSLGLDLPKLVEDLLARALALNPLERPHDVGVFWTQLKEAIANSPKANLSAATVMDNSLGDAMQQVRAAASHASMQPAPFTGTMLMQSAPFGAAHLGPRPEEARLLPVPLPASGRPFDAGPGVETLGPITSPMGSPARGQGQPQEGGKPPSMPPPPVPASVEQARPRGDIPTGTLLIGAMSPLSGMSPLAASMAVPSPLPGSGGTGPPPPFGGPAHQQQQHQQHQQHQQSQQHQQHQQPQAPQPQARPASYPPGARGAQTDPRMDSRRAPPKYGAGGIVFVVVCLAVAAMGIAFYVFQVRGH